MRRTNSYATSRWFAVAVVALSGIGSTHADQIQAAVAAKSNPSELQFLKGLNLTGQLQRDIAQDVRTLPPAQAKQRALQRLRIDLGKKGVITLQPGSKDARLDPNLLKSAFPDALVMSTATTAYRLLATLQQTVPGQPEPEIQVVGSQTIPGTPQPTLGKCDVDFDTLSKGCGPVKSGMRCETFARQQFPEVAKIVTPGGGVCSGTLISDRWVLSAAHCFLPTVSASDFARDFADRRTPSGDAILRGHDLGSTALYLPYAFPDIASQRRAVELVIVYGRWNPNGNDGPGKMVTIADKAVAANYAYPGDLALVRIKDTHAVPGATAEPAVLPSQPFSGVITTAGYGYTTVGAGDAGELWVTWPEPKVGSAHGQLELQFVGGPAISTFCRGDSGGPAFAGRHRGCKTKAEAGRPRTVVGVTSYYYGANSDLMSPSQTAETCMQAPIMRFVDLSAEENRKWICRAKGGQQNEC